MSTLEAEIHTMLSVSAHRRSQRLFPGMKNGVANPDKSDSLDANYEAARVTEHHPASS